MSPYGNIDNDPIGYESGLELQRGLTGDQRATFQTAVAASRGGHLASDRDFPPVTGAAESPSAERLGVEPGLPKEAFEVAPRPRHG